MCRGCFILLILFIISESLRAQPIHLAEDSLSSTISLGTEILELQNYVINDLGQESAVQWLKNTSAPESWTVNLCDDVACFTDTFNDNVLFLNPGDSSQLKGQFFAGEVGEGRLDVTVTALDTDGAVFTIQTSFTVIKTLESTAPELASVISIYPNPATDVLKVKMNSNSHYSILNVLGQTLINGDLISGVNTLDIELLNSGIYYLKISSDRSFVFTIRD